MLAGRFREAVRASSIVNGEWLITDNRLLASHQLRRKEPVVGRDGRYLAMVSFRVSPRRWIPSTIISGLALEKLRRIALWPPSAWG